MRSDKKRDLLIAMLTMLLMIGPLLLTPRVRAQETDESDTVQVTITPFLVNSEEGFPVMAEWGTLIVPERRDVDDSGTIETPFLRFKTSAAKPGPPIVYIDDGPKLEPSTLADSSRFLRMVAIFGPTSDVIIIEQRGGGQARPRLDCADAYDVTLSREAEQGRLARLASAYSAACSRRWNTAGVDLAGYNALEMAADIEDLRQALGYDQVRLLGVGFGSHVGLTMIKQYEESVERAAFVLVQGPNQMLILPDSVQLQLERLDARVKADPVLSQQIPDFIGLVAQVLLRLEQNPVTVPVADPETGETINVTVGKLDLQRATSLSLAHTDQRALPAEYYAMSRGDFAWLGAQALDSRQNIDEGLLPPTVKCASNATDERIERAQEQEPNSILGDSVNGVWPETCTSIGDVKLDDEFRAPVVAETPVLLISGNMDSLTPDSNGDAVLIGLENGQQLVVDGASHELVNEALPLITPLLVEFMLGDPYATIEAPNLAIPFNLVPVQIVPVAVDGWAGEYFNNLELLGEPALVRDDAEINFLWGDGSPAPEITADNFSVRWSKSRELPAGVYRFSITADNGVRLWINDTLVLDKWTESPLRSFVVDVSLVRGVHNARLEYFHSDGNAAVRMEVSQVQDFPDWKTEYFDNPNLTGEPVVLRNEQTINYQWGQSAPAPGVPASNWSGRWSQRANFDEGDYTFTVKVAGGARLWLDGRLLIASWADQGPRELQVNSGILARGEHDIRVEYFKTSGDGALQLYWTPALPATPPTARISGPTRGQVGQPLLYDASASTAAEGKELIAYEWDFGDGFVANGVRVEHAYDQPGFYNIVLSVTDEANLNDKVGLQVQVDNAPIPPSPDQPPVAVISAPSQGVVGEPVLFDATNSQSTNPIVSFAWQFGDGSIADAIRVAKTYGAPAMYNVTLTLTDDQGLQSTTTQLILISEATESISAPTEATPTPLPPPTLAPTPTPLPTQVPVATPTFTPIPPGQGVQPQPTPTQVGGISPQPTPTQAGGGSPPPAAGNVDGPTANIAVSVNGQIIPADLSNPERERVRVQANQQVVFDGSGSAPGNSGSPIINYAWYMPGNQDTFPPETNITTLFQNVGVYDMTLTVTDQNGQPGTKTINVEVIQ